MSGSFRAPGGGPLQVRLEQISDRCFISEVAFEYVETLDDGSTKTSSVPAHIRTDLASIPKYLRFFEGRHGRHTLAALLHDHQVDGKESLPDRAEADDRFRRALIDLGLKKWRATVMWSAVHLNSRLKSSNLVAKLATGLWLVSALSGCGLLLYSLFTAQWSLTAFACVGPVFGALLWAIPTPSFKRYLCGLVAGIALSVLGPFAIVNLFVMTIAFLLDALPGSKPAYQWPGSSICPKPCPQAGTECFSRCRKGYKPSKAAVK